MRAYGNCRGYQYPCDQPLHVKDDPRPSVRKRREQAGQRHSTKPRAIRCVETGVTYPSMNAAHKATGVCNSSIERSMRSGRAYMGYTFEQA